MTLKNESSRKTTKKVTNSQNKVLLPKEKHFDVVLIELKKKNCVNMDNDSLKSKQIHFQKAHYFLYICQIDIFLIIRSFYLYSLL